MRTMELSEPTISLCMIVKDEEHWIADCIASVRTIVAEIIVVDTGSSDSTVAIARSCGARVLSRPWDDDFSAPRNLSIKEATSDWILVLDADERIAASDCAALKALTRCTGRAYEFLQRHYTNDQRISSFTPCRGEYPQEEHGHGGYFVSNLCRLFPNLPGVEYRNRVHELIEASLYERQDITIERTGIPIHHYGHTAAAREKKDKSRIYTPLGARKVVDEPDNWKNHFELAVELNGNGKLRESVTAFRSAAAINPDYTQTWINLGFVLNELHAFGSAIEALSRALALEPANPEAHCNIAVTYMRMQRYPFAESHLRRALNERPNYTNALCNLGQTFFAQKKFEEARDCYLKVLDLMPGNVSALSDLAAVLTQQGAISDAIKLLERAIEIDDSSPRSYYYLGLALKQNDQARDALEKLEKFCSLVKEKNPADAMLAAVEKTCAEWSAELHNRHTS